eukprot:Gb_11318 [translate_table: standard]
MAANYISEKLNWVRNHLVVSLALSCSSLFLLIPQVYNIFMYFSPLLVSTALCVTALLSVRSYYSPSEDHGGAKFNNFEYNSELEESILGELGEDSMKSGVHVEDNMSFIECVKELHESGIVLFESMFKLEVKQQPINETLIVSEENHVKASEDNHTHREETSTTASVNQVSVTEVTAMDEGCL